MDMILGLLTAEEQAVCLAHLRGCPACEERARAFASLHERARARSQGLVPSATSADAAGQGTPRIGPRPIRRLLRPLWSLPAAAAAILVLVLLQRADHVGSNAPSPGWLMDPTRILITNRAEGDATRDRLLLDGLAAYGRHDVDTAVAHLRQAEAPPSLEPIRRAYLGNALLHHGQARDALDVLRSLRDEEIPAAIRQETRWTLMTAYARAGRAASAESLRALLALEPGEVGDRARRAGDDR